MSVVRDVSRAAFERDPVVLGVVEDHPASGKIAVMFASGRKVLVHSMGTV